MPMGMADIATVLFRQYLSVSPNHEDWLNRDRFVLSNGHGAMLQYAVLHLAGFDVTLDDIKQFRQLHSKTPGHPEFGHTSGVETTTGPLGQGLANAVGLAIAEQRLAAEFNQLDLSIIDHYTYAFVGDGCLMEGISHEASSLAGSLRLGKLIVFWDDNGISIDGDVSGWFQDDTIKRFEAYGWQVIADVDGHDPEAISQAIEQAQAEALKPTLIACRTQIGFGSPKMVGTAKVHGSPLGEDEVVATREALNWPHAAFEIPDEIRLAWSCCERGDELHAEWQARWQMYQDAFPSHAQELRRRQAGQMPAGWAEWGQQIFDSMQSAKQSIATRQASRQCLERMGLILPELMGGSADLTGSNCTDWSESTDFTASNRQGNYLRYGVREFAMAAIMNGLALYGGLLPYGGTFLVFSDYMRNAMRLSALMQQRVVYVLTHDSIGLGEDGPTHQPVEHLAMCRLTPGLDVWRPADAAETWVAWQSAVEKQGPSVLCLSRQSVPALSHCGASAADVAKGGYILSDRDNAQALIIATGSECQLALAAQEQLDALGVAVRVISMPCVSVFLAQPVDYQQSVLPPAIQARVAVEAAAADYWYRFVGLSGKVVGMTSFGLSAPAKEIYEDLGITSGAVTAAVQSVLAQQDS